MFWGQSRITLTFVTKDDFIVIKFIYPSVSGHQTNGT